MGWLKHAFALDPPGPAKPNSAQREIVERLCHELKRRRLTVVALGFLEMVRPLNYFGSQLLYFFGPMVTAFADARGYEQFASFLEQRGSIDYICLRLEEEDEVPRERDRAATTKFD